MLSTVTIRGQTAIPSAIRKKYKILPKSKLAWLDDGFTISVLPIPKDPVNELRGKYKNIDFLKALIESRNEERKSE
ncbi:AbrB/MazE/SpoVT family DNA-binding domain-containing protein [candidate division WOR-3 bacterium]|nr:AbrB/MazE/SpoVT family DNA-binding domain-containing protein [candidate division WOR-3 bacterium]